MDAFAPPRLQPPLQPLKDRCCRRWKWWSYTNCPPSDVRKPHRLAPHLRHYTSRRSAPAQRGGCSTGWYRCVRVVRDSRTGNLQFPQRAYINKADPLTNTHRFYRRITVVIWTQPKPCHHHVCALVEVPLMYRGVCTGSMFCPASAPASPAWQVVSRSSCRSPAPSSRWHERRDGWCSLST